MVVGLSGVMEFEHLPESQQWRRGLPPGSARGALKGSSPRSRETLSPGSAHITVSGIAYLAVVERHQKYHPKMTVDEEHRDQWWPATGSHHQLKALIAMSSPQSAKKGEVHCPSCRSCCSTPRPARNDPRPHGDLQPHRPVTAEVGPHVAARDPVLYTAPMAPMLVRDPLSAPLFLPPGGVARPHPHAPSTPWHNFGHGPTPLFGWHSVVPLAHSYGQPQYVKTVKPDYRRFCFSVGKADVPYAALPGGPLEGFPSHMAPQLVGRW